jgi:RND family efflux transporter MFP subunit
MSPIGFIVSRKGGLPALIIVVAITIGYLLIATRSELKPVEQPERVWPIKAVQAMHRDVQPEIHLFGEVVAGRRSELRALVNGVIVEVGENLREGGVAKKGELLIAIDPFDYKTALAEQRWMLQEAEARLEQLRREYVRAKNLYKEKNVSQEFLDNAELAVLQQEAIVGQRAVGVQRAEHEVADSRLVAPYDGVVSSVNANLGNSVSNQGDKLADLVDTSQLEVRFSLSNAQYGRLLENDESVVGRAVDVSWKVGNKNLAYTAVIKRVGGEIVSTTGGIDAYAVIDTAGKQTTLRPGAFVAVRLLDMQYRNVLEVLDTALYGQDLVYIVEGDRLSARRIRIHGYDGQNILFSSADELRINDGDLIVTTQLREGGVGVKVAVQ